MKLYKEPPIVNDADVLLEFLKMPLGNSDEVFKTFSTLPGAIHRGIELEQFLFVKGKRDDRVLLVAHADTHWDTRNRDNGHTPQEIVQENGVIRNAHGGLGADDRAGCAILWLLRDMGHSLLITDGEERGGRGSDWLMNENRDIADEINDNHQFAIQFDRRNGKDFKCYTVGTDEFRAYVQQSTGYSEPNRSAYTDVVTLCRRITGVNLSIGYQNEHSNNERLVLQDWQHTLDVCRAWLSQAGLPRFDLLQNNA